MTRISISLAPGDGFGPKTRHFHKTSLTTSSRERFCKKGVKPVIPVTCQETAEVPTGHSFMDRSLNRLAQGIEAGVPPVADLDVLNALRGNQVLRASNGLFRLEGVPPAEKLPVQPGAPDEAVAKITDLARRLGNPHCERICHLICPSGRRLRESITALSSRASKYTVMPNPLRPKEVS